MGSSHQAKTLLSEFTIQKSQGNISILSKKSNNSQKYLMKTYTANTKEQLISKLRFFKNYKSKMQQNQQLTKIVEIIEQKDQYFCSTSHKLHIIFQFSDLHIGKQIKVRRQSMIKIHKRQNYSYNSKYFNYEDLCNILYSCLSALWFNKETLNDNPDFELKKYGTIFISSQNILIFENGILKIMDPFINHFNHRYLFHENIYYSPQKLANFTIIDDEKCSLFQLGMTLLEISLLQPLTESYAGQQYMEEVTIKKIQKARQIYSAEIQNSLTVSVFDLIQKMVERERQQRFNLEEAIQYAQQMYQTSESFAQEASPSHPTRFYTSKSKQLHKTNHSTCQKKTASVNKFCDFKNSAVFARNQETGNLSPKITNFTIQQVDAEKQQQSSMLESLTIDNRAKKQQISQSIVKGGIFSGINIEDSYSYGINQINSLKFNNSRKSQNLFTDPQLMKTIYRQLKQIQDRKKNRIKDDSIFRSNVFQRKDRYQLYQDINTSVKISNAAYLE